MRLVFMGSDPLALPLLDWLLGEGAQVATLVGVVTGVDQPSGRGQSVKPNAVKAWTRGKQLEVLQPERLDPAARLALSSLRPDVVLVVAYGRILRDDFISIAPLGTLNLHASLLPRYRGASPIQTSVACGDRETGLSLMRIVRELDAGPVADVERVAIDRLDTGAEIEAKLGLAAIPLVRRSFPLLAQGRLEFRPQDPTKASFCRRHEKSDGVLDFAAPAQVLSARVNGLNPWPSVTVPFAGVSLKLGLADTVESWGVGEPGKVLGCDAEGLIVATGRGALRIRKLQRPGGRMLAAPEFLRGFPIEKGSCLPSAPMPGLEAHEPFRR